MVGISLYAFALFIVEPLVSLYWRGVWFLTDWYLLPGDSYKSAYVSLVIGYFVFYVFHASHKEITDFVGNSNPLQKQLLVPVLLVLIGMAQIWQWRGLWCLLDIHCGISTYGSAIGCIFVGTAMLCVSHTQNAWLASVPFELLRDDISDLFAAPSIYQHISHESKVWFLVDHSLSVLWVQSFAIVYWRGVWFLEDFTILPHSPLYSGLVTFVVGHFLVILLFLLENSFQKFLEYVFFHLHGILDHRKLWSFLAFLWRFTAGISVVTLWRSQWTIVDFWLINLENKTHTVFGYNYWVLSIVCGFMLWSLNAWSVASLRGCEEDTTSIRFRISFNKNYDTPTALSKTVHSQVCSETKKRNLYIRSNSLLIDGPETFV